MSKALYTAHAHVTGGRSGRGRTTDETLDLVLRRPKELGGDGEGANPEQLFAIGYAACFGATLTLVGQRSGLTADDVMIDSSVSLIPGEDGRFALGVEMRITLPSVTDEQAAGLVRTAHQVCPYSNATRGNIDVLLVANGNRL
ncbi:organic hydroperoxide resistance protein [Streptomyces sp. NPDC093094]|uniref:organic hydroperoxide resistance protein n=1 Tax=Streptomyces sp. NPDC093094 TaxID=3366026 RepID=UPI00380CC3BB